MGRNPVINSKSYQTAWAFAGLLVLTFLLFSPALFCGTVFLDDQSYVMENTHVLTGFSKENFMWSFREHFGFLSPLLWFSFQLDTVLFGPDAFGFHFTNVLLHSLNAGLLFLLIRRLTGSFWKALAVAILWGWHPLRVESVAWITERKDVLCVFFMFLALHAYVSFVRKRSTARMGLVFLLMMAGLMVKSILVVFPFLLLILDFWPLQRFSKHWKPVLAEKIPLFAGAAVYAVVGWFAHTRAITSLEEWSIADRLAVALQNFMFYLEKTFCPLGLAAPYPLVKPAWPVAVASLIGLVALTVVFWLLRRKAPWGLAGWLWFGIALAPVCGLVQIGSVTTADRFMYLPAIGLTAAVVWGLSSIRLPAKEIVIVAAVACALLSVRQIAFWRSSDTFFRRTLAVTENNGVAHSLYGAWLVMHNRDAEAFPHLSRAVELVPQYLPANKGLGLLYFKQGDFDRAMYYIEAAFACSDDQDQASKALEVCRGIIEARKKALHDKKEGNEQ